MRNNLNQKGFGLIAFLLLTTALVIIFFAYVKPRYESALKTKKQAEDQAKQFKKNAQQKIRDTANNINDKIQNQMKNEKKE